LNAATQRIKAETPTGDGLIEATGQTIERWQTATIRLLW